MGHLSKSQCPNTLFFFLNLACVAYSQVRSIVRKWRYIYYFGRFHHRWPELSTWSWTLVLLMPSGGWIRAFLPTGNWNCRRHFSETFEIREYFSNWGDHDLARLSERWFSCCFGGIAFPPSGSVVKRSVNLWSVYGTVTDALQASLTHQRSSVHYKR